MLGDEVVDRICRGAVTARRLERERMEGRACCRAEFAVLDTLVSLGPCTGDVARVVRRWGRLVSSW